MPARILAAPFIIGALLFLFLTWEVDGRYSWWIIPWVIALAVVFTLSPQINWWWYQRYPPDLNTGLRKMLERFSPYYQRLSKEEQLRFRQRMALYQEANDFMGKGIEDVPADLKAVAAACAVQLTFGKEDFLLSPFEHIIFFPQPFPSPQYPENYHASEIYEEDGAVLFSAEQLMKGFLEPGAYYNIGLHEYAKAFERVDAQQEFPPLGEGHWEELEQISGFSYPAIQQWINLDPIPLRPVSITLFFTFPDRFREVCPKLYAAYARIFNQSPAVGEVLNA
ncbi:zinc-dependent peptidase [Phaeodactylibacter luteus]|nr:zinc-dependent peptidase [Phaeodactylibacter luteus]